MDTPQTPLLHYVRHYDNVMTPALIEQLMQWFARPGIVRRRTPLYVFDEKEVSPDNDTALQGELMKAAGKAINLYTQDCGIIEAQWPHNYSLEGFRMKRYQDGTGKFDPHVDVTDRNTCTRFLVIMFYLTTRGSGEGGGTTFIDGKEIAPVAGRVALFPPLWPWLHAGGSPQGWHKYTIQTYLHYA